MQTGAMLRDPFRDKVRLLEGMPVRTIVDAGAYRGDTVEEYRSRFPEAQVWAFEPTPDSFTALDHRFRADGRVEPLPLALANRAGTSALHLFRSAPGNSLLPLAAGGGDWSDDPSGLEVIDTRHVETTTLNAFCEQEGIAEIDILKLDLQGGELRALNGAAWLLERQAIKLIYAEVLFVPLYEGQAWFHDVNRALIEHGYRLYNLYGLVHAADGRLKWADGLWMTEAVDAALRARPDAIVEDPVRVELAKTREGVLIRVQVDRTIVDATSIDIAVNAAPDGSWSGEWTYLSPAPLDDEGRTSALWDSSGIADGQHLVAINLHLRSGETIWWGDQPFRTYTLDHTA